jgi:hypothetical protein
MTKSKSKQAEDRPKANEQPESPAKPNVETRASSWPVPKGFVVEDSPSQQIFVGGFPCAPPKKPK